VKQKVELLTGEGRLPRVPCGALNTAAIQDLFWRSERARTRWAPGSARIYGFLTGPLPERERRAESSGMEQLDEGKEYSPSGLRAQSEEALLPVLSLSTMRARIALEGD
jgi:hypothetical protein